jgi:tetratricopeptide (TPR) repeat protein
MRPRPSSPALLLALLLGCATDGTSPATDAAPAPEAEPATEDTPEALAALERARELMRTGDPRDAMLELDEALALRAPGLAAEVQLLRGVATLQMGTEDGVPMLFEDAHAAFTRAAEAGIPAAWSGVARAAGMLHYQSGDPARMEEALDLAVRAVEERDAGRTLEDRLRQTPERTLSEIAYDYYRMTRTGALPPESAPELFEITRGSLENEIRIDPGDAWAWERLADLYLWEQRSDEARGTLARAVELEPDSEALHRARVRVLESTGGWGDVVPAYEEFVAAHEGSALGRWFLGTARYEAALAAMLAGEREQAEAFRAAEADFVATRELEPSYAESCRSYELVCRDGLGWSLYHAGDLEGAAAAFLSMEDLQEGGLRWEDPGRLFSGLRSLEFVVAAHNERWMQVFEQGSGVSYGQAFPHLEAAAELATRAFEYDPEAANAANNAGYFNRDLAVEYERQGVRALASEPSDEERAAERFARARETMERSYEAYVVAARLAPTDARVINDTGLILTYYLQRDLDDARAYLEQALEVGLPALEGDFEDEEARTAAREAVGDAYQNLGVLELTLLGDAAAARPHFEASLQYERAPRVQVTSFFLPLCDAVEAGALSADDARAAHAWGELGLETVRERLAAVRRLREALGSE